MDSDELNYNEHLQEMSAEELVSPDSSGGDIPEDAPAPRIGDEYQAVLPDLPQELGDLQYLGLAIPIGWVSSEASCDSQNLICSRSNNNRGNSPAYHSRSYQAIACISEDMDVSSTDKHLQLGGMGDQLNVDKMQIERAVNYTPLPRGSSNPWNDDEIEIFILGLYIFGKNLVHLQKFVEDKTMGDILSLYYGKFYMCQAHRKWSECKKSRGRKRVLGHHLLSSWRQHELLSRLLPSMSEESQKHLLEATRKFNGDGMSLVKYAFFLKDIVGVKVLAEAVGIGKGKHDLTSVLVDPSRGNQTRSIQSEVPIGKACSSLTDAELVKILTGDYRLSKARSNDLFWEAVWPRLLARGWHSEQPKDQAFAVPKNSLIFLAPGIKKFSRRKLDKGEHYFDSITDVLNKVASDPRVLEMGSEHVTIALIDGPGCTTLKGTKLEHDDAGDECHREDLCPKSPRFTSCHMKFTVVDTSLVQGESPFRVRELRSLPMNIPTAGLPSSPSNEMDTSCSRDHQDDSTDESLNNEQKKSLNTVDVRKLEDIVMVDKFERETKPDGSGFHTNVSPIVKKCNPSGIKDWKKSGRQLGTERMSSNQPLDYKVEVPKRKRGVSEAGTSRKQPVIHGKEVIKHQFTRRRKTGNFNFLVPVPKKTKITCNNSENGPLSHSLIGGIHLHEKARSKAFDAIVDLAAELCQPRHEPSSALGKTGPLRSCETSCIMELVEEDPQQRDFIDLNLPQYPPEFDAHGRNRVEMPMNANPVLPETVPLPDVFSHRETCSQSDTEQQSDMNLRRQSTRSRPLTTRALEALESGFLNIKRRARGYRFPQSDAPRYSRRTERTMEASISLTSGNGSGNKYGTTDMKGTKRDDECSSHPKETAFPSKSQFEVANA